MKEKLAARYAKGWLTADQLRRYAALGAITMEELDEVLGEAGTSGQSEETGQ